MNFDFLVEMVWKSALISGGAVAAAAALRFRPAGERSAVLRTAVAMILALPLVVLLLPSLPVVTHTVQETVPPAYTLLPASDPLLLASTPAPAASSWDDPASVLEWLWLGGATMVVLRLVAGLMTLRRWTRDASAPASPQWHQALARACAAAGCRKDVRLRVGDAPSPISWGWRHPVILLDRDTARDPAEAEAVLAHEVAHIVRRDWAMLILARLAVALFWFNPLMWLLERRLIVEAEEAADARALASVEPEAYAQTLLSCARQAGAPRVPATGMADRSLGRRVKAILARRLRVGAPDPRRVRMAMALCALVAAPIAALKPVVATVYAPAAPRAEATPATFAQADRAAAPTAPEVPAPPADTDEASQAPEAPEAPAVPPPGAVPPAPFAPAAPALAAFEPPAPPAPPRPPRPPREGWAPVDGQAIADSVNEAVRESLAASQDAVRAASRAQEQVRRELTPERMAEIRRAERAQAEVRRELTPERMAEIRRATEQASLEARRGIAAGAVGMEEGVRGMEQGAREMDSEADKLRSPGYRAEQIAHAAREGRRLTDAELLAMIPKLHHGAEKLRQGALRMRSEGDRMRRGG